MVIQLHVILLLVCSIFVVWSLNKWLRSPRSEPSLRKYFGSISLALGSGSAALLASFYIYIWIDHALPAHGLALWTYFVVGAVLSIAGMVLGSISIGYLRQSTLLITLVTFFEWIRELVAGAKARRLIDVLMFIAIGMFGVALLGRKWYSGRN